MVRKVFVLAWVIGCFFKITGYDYIIFVVTIRFGWQAIDDPVGVELHGVFVRWVATRTDPAYCRPI